MLRRLSLTLKISIYLCLADRTWPRHTGIFISDDKRSHEYFVNHLDRAIVMSNASSVEKLEVEMKEFHDQ